MSTPDYRPLTHTERRLLESHGCRAADWSDVFVAGDFDPGRVRDTEFAGTVLLGRFEGEAAGGRPSGLYRAAIRDCDVGDDVRIANVGVEISGYTVGDRACIEDVGLVEARPGAVFGQGVEVEVVNEGGGREVELYPELDAQIAELLAGHRHRPLFVERLRRLVGVRVAHVPEAEIGAGCVVRSVRRMVDVRLGPGARVEGAASLVNGTVLSGPEAPTLVGSGVEAEDFLIAEGAVVDGGAMLRRTFVGQGCRVGRGFSAENCLFFANSEAFHGEACSVFAGPYTVTHHRSTLLIAGRFSFYNAGSGTNQSNHRYKVGPVHEGTLERGTKTGSFSYLMWPSRVGPFSVVLGKHTRSFDTSDFPFSHLDAEPDGRTALVPGFNLSTVGTLRDGEKWPRRDRRRGRVRDRVCFDVMSPLTAGRMRSGLERLRALHETTPREVERVTVGGIEIKRLLLRRGVRSYEMGLELYLLDRLAERLEAVAPDGTALGAALAADPEAVLDEAWVDLGGQLLPRARLERLYEDVERGEVASLEAVAARLDEAFFTYREDEWAWVRHGLKAWLGHDLDAMGADGLAALLDAWRDVRERFLRQVLADASKEYDESARIGYGVEAADAEADFQAVRGAYEDDAFVRGVQAELASLPARAARLKDGLRRASLASPAVL